MKSSRVVQGKQTETIPVLAMRRRGAIRLLDEKGLLGCLVCGKKWRGNGKRVKKNILMPASSSWKCPQCGSHTKTRMARTPCGELFLAE
jgi:hypothetical protein